MNQRRVVVTGLGIIAPGSLGKEEFWRNCASGTVFTGPLKAFSQEGIRCPVSAEIIETEAFQALAGEIAAAHGSEIYSRAQLLALMGVELAIRDSGLTRGALPAEKVHIAVGSTHGDRRFGHEKAAPGWNEWSGRNVRSPCSREYHRLHCKTFSFLPIPRQECI